MAASDNLHPKLFHGSRSWLKPGDTIEPGHDHWYGDTEHGSGAYASVYASTARNYAAKWDDPDKSDTEYPDAQRSLFHPVYEVEHVSEHSDPERTLLDTFPHYRRDTKGFRVKGIAGWSVGNDYRQM